MRPEVAEPALGSTQPVTKGGRSDEVQEVKWFLSDALRPSPLPTGSPSITEVGGRVSALCHLGSWWGLCFLPGSFCWDLLGLEVGEAPHISCPSLEALPVRGTSRLLSTPGPGWDGCDRRVGKVEGRGAR